MARLSLFLPFLSPLCYVLVLVELEPAGAFPCGNKLFAGTTLAVLLVQLMDTVRVLAVALKILRSVDRDVGEVSAPASRLLALYLIILSFQEIVVLEVMIAKTFGRGAHHLALQPVGVGPVGVHSVLSQFVIVLFVLLILFLAHHFASVVPD